MSFKRILRYRWTTMPFSLTFAPNIRKLSKLLAIHLPTFINGNKNAGDRCLFPSDLQNVFLKPDWHVLLIAFTTESLDFKNFLVTILNGYLTHMVSIIPSSEAVKFSLLSP